MIKASIIIPTYNRGKLLCNILRNLIGQLPTDGEIVVVDQSDEVCSELMEIAKNHSTQIHYYKIFVKGLPHARNYGLKRAIGEIIIFCDDDVIPNHTAEREKHSCPISNGKYISPQRRKDRKEFIFQRIKKIFSRWTLRLCGF